MNRVFKYRVFKRKAYDKDEWALQCWFSEGCKANDKWVLHQWKKEPTEAQIADTVWLIERSMDYMYKHICIEQMYIKSERIE